jgi:uncharacterized membrane protein
MLTGLGLRAYQLDTKGFWGDEAWTMMVSTGRGATFTELPLNQLLYPAPNPTTLSPDVPFYAAWTNTSFDVHPPLYAVIVRLWRAAVGESDVAVRLLSVVTSTLAVGLIYAVGRRALSPMVGLWAATLMAFGPQQVFYAQQARSYGLATALSLAAMLAVLKFLQDGATWPRRAAIIVLSCAMVLTHYFTAGLAAALCGYAWWSRADQRRRRDAAFCLIGGLLLAAVSWLPFAIDQRIEAGGIGGWLDDSGPGRAGRLFGALVAAPVSLLGEAFLNPLAADVVFTGVTITLPLIFIRRHRGLLLPYLGLVLCLAQPLVLDAMQSTRTLREVRYVLLAMPSLCLVLASFAQVLHGPLRHAVPALALVFSLFGLFAGDAYRKRYGDWRELATPLAAAGNDGRVLAVAGHHGESATIHNDPRYMYLCVERYLPPGRPVVLLNDRASDETLKQLRQHGDIWLISAMEIDLEQVLPGSRLVDPRPHAFEFPLGTTLVVTFDPPTTAPTVSESSVGTKTAR